MSPATRGVASHASSARLTSVRPAARVGGRTRRNKAAARTKTVLASTKRAKKPARARQPAWPTASRRCASSGSGDRTVSVRDHVLHVREGAQVVGGSLGDALPARGKARDRPLEQEFPVERLVVHVEAGEGRERAGR